MIEKIFILHHRHCDIGYTGDQDRINEDNIRFLDKVTELVESSLSRPDPERFRWIHEISWPVFEYIRERGQLTEEHLELIRKGYIELTALYMNPTDLFDRYNFEVSTDYACELAREHGLPLTVGMFTDCPGIPWRIVDILAERNVKYLSTSPNPPQAWPLEVERPFYWEGPDGGRVLVWFSDWRKGCYSEGLRLELRDKGPAEGTKNLLNYIAQLESEEYRWKGLAIHVAWDNGDVLPKLMDFVKCFNESQSQRTVQLATNGDFFEYMESQHSHEFSVHKGAWPDWWANGHASAAFEVSCSRKAKASLERSIALARQTAIELDNKLLHEITENILMFDEHTWVVNGQIIDTWDSRSRLQWALSRIHAMKALHGASRLESELGLSLGKENLVLANPFEKDFSGVVYMTGEERGRKHQALKDTATGELIALQRILPKDTAGKGGFCCSLELKPNSIRRFEHLKTKAPETEIPEGLDNDYFRIDFDEATGAVTSIIDKQNERELCDKKAEWSFAELIHERLKGGLSSKIYDPKRKDLWAIYDPTYGYANPEAKRPRPDFIRKAGHTSNRRNKIICGPVFNSLVSFGSLPGVRFAREVRLYHSMRRIDVLLQLDKDVITTYEGLYLAFPFAVGAPDIWVENAGAVYRAGIDQLPGSATDWHSLGNYATIGNQDNTVILVPHDSPLIQIGDVNTGKWAKRLDISNGHIYSWLMNNRWFTNFPAYQEGRVNLSWSLTNCPGDFDRTEAENFAHNARVGVTSNMVTNLEPVVW